MYITPSIFALIGLLLAAWTGVAAWMIVAASNRARQAENSRRNVQRLSRMLDEAPAIPMLVRADGRLEAPERLAHWLGLERVPNFLNDLAAAEEPEEGGARGRKIARREGQTLPGLTRDQVEALAEQIRRTQKTAAPFQTLFTVPGSGRSLAFKGSLADPQVSPGGAALVWVFDFSQSASELKEARSEARQARNDFAALVGLIEAAPMPMWFRSADSRLKLVNSAFVEAVGAENAEQVVGQQIELVETVDGLTAAQIAEQSLARDMKIERIVTATVGEQRRTLKVSDLPLGKEGVAGYAVDIEEMEELGREFKAFREAQRQMLDQLSIGVAQFNKRRQLIFANQPFRRTFALSRGSVTQKTTFERFLVNARENGCTPEVRDFPSWRTEHLDWFTSGEAKEEAWPLASGVHLRIIAQPMPDGGLVLIAEDRTEELALSATRDTLLRTRTATFDSLFESLAVFAPDGQIQIWNRRFAPTWGIDPKYLDKHPSADELLADIGRRLARPKQASLIGETIRAATLDRRQQGGRVSTSDGRTLEFAGVPLPDGNGLLTVLDITDSQKAEDALRERNQALEEADAVKTRFLANMSYELRTPLTSIGGFAELLEAGVAGELTDQGREYVEAILTSVARLREQVENVLDLSQSEAGLMPMRAERIELLPFVTDLVREREAVIESGGLTLDLRGTKASGAVSADPRQIGKAIGQLLDNAIAATGEGGKILIDLSRRGDVSRIVISDNGPGMSEAAIARAFAEGGVGAGEDSNIAGENQSDGSGEGQGIGLRLARQLVEAHGGSLTLQSELGVGTSAVIMLK